MSKKFDGTWKEIWTQIGAQDSKKENVSELGGWERVETPIEEVVKKLHEFLNIEETDKVLEIGCGAGTLAQYMKCDYIGVDFSRTSIKKCMEYFQQPAIYAEANNLPFKDKYFDKCFAYGMFMYFPDKKYTKQVIQEMIRVTKNMIFVGELPIESHEPKHQLFTRNEFEKYGFTSIDGWVKPYQNIRFSIYKEF